MKSVFLRSCASVVVVCALTPGISWAQATPDASPAAATTPAAPAPAASSSESIGEIIVTANRREENLQRVPVTAEVTTGAQLAAAQITSTQDLSNFTPGLNISRANVGAVPFLRGVGAVTATVGNEAAVATYVDDVYRPAAGASNYAFNDVERVEVLNGPQGTLFGRNAAGGVINVVTRDPSSSHPVVDAEIGYGNYDTFTGALYASSPITSNLAADIAVYGNDQTQGWGKNLYDGKPTYTQHAISVHSKWVWTPTDADKFTLTAYYDREYNQQGASSNVLPGTINAAGFGHVGGFFDVDNNLDAYDLTRTAGVDLKYQHDFGHFNVTSITSYQRTSWVANIENDSSPANYQEATVNANEPTFQQELRIASDAKSTIQWIGGLYYFHDISSAVPFVQYGTALKRFQNIQFTNSTQRTNSYAGFGQATVPLASDTHLTIGLRYSDDLRNVVGQSTAYPSATATSPTLVFNAGSQSTKAGAPTARAVLDHNFTEDIMLYASYNRGFKSGNFNTNNVTVASTLPEKLNAYEIGAKTAFFDRKLQIDVSGFYYNMIDLQVQQQLSTGTIQTNAGAARYEGVDLAIVARPIRQFTLTWSTEYLHANYTQYANAQYNRVNPNGGMTSYIVNAAGQPIPYADPFTSSISGRYTFDFMQGKIALDARAGYHHGFNFDTQGLLKQPSYTDVNGSITWIAPSTNWQVSIWTANLTNARYYAQEQVSATGETYSAAAPRTFGIKFKVHI